MTLRPLIAVAVLGVVAAVTVLRLRPPASAAGVDAGRVTRVLNAVAAEPHPAGSAANDRVRRFLVGELEGFGYDVTVQTGELPHYRYDALGVPIGNVVATLAGTGETGDALLLVAHFDSRPGGSRGAGDDAAGVAAVVEAAAQLAEDRPRNDVVVLLADAEEAGLLGAWLWVVETSPELMNARLALNFEGRGARGPATLFETGRGDGWPVGVYARAVPHPVASSLGPAVYELMPNATDFTALTYAPGDLPAFLAERIPPGVAPDLPGLNFAFIGGYEHYHQRSDTPANLSGRTLFHHATQAAALARAFGDADLSRAGAGGNAVFFDYWSLLVVRYPAWAAWPVGAVALGLSLVAAWRVGGGWRAWAAAAGWLAAGHVAAVAWAQLFAAFLPHPAAGADYAVIWPALAVAAVGTAVAFGRHARRSAATLSVAAAVLGLAATAVLPGASYIFAVVALAGAAAAALPWPAAVAAVAALTVPLVVASWQVGLGLMLPLAGVPAGVMHLAGVAWAPLARPTSSTS